MCIKLGEDELDTVRNLMSMSLYAILSEALDADIDEIEGSMRLREELHMDASRAAVLQRLISEYFDEAVVDLNQVERVEQLIERLINSELPETTV